MKAIVFDNELKLEQNYSKPAPQKGEALIKVTLAGICNTDYEITKGYMGYVGVLGHEFVGIVEDVNSSGLVPITINEKFKEYLLDKTKGGMTTNYRLSSILTRSNDILYVKPVAIDCDEVLDENVEVEEIVEEGKGKKDYSKLIWIALAAAAALL